MSSNISPPLILGLEPDRSVLAVVAMFAMAAMVAVAYSPLELGLRAGLVLLIGGLTAKAVCSRLVGPEDSRPRRVVFSADGSWLIELGDGRQCAVRLLATTACLGTWWFLHWPGEWAVVTARGQGERDWRRLTARLRDRPAVIDKLRTASTRG